MLEAINEIIPGASEQLENAFSFVHEWYLRGLEYWLLLPGIVRYAIVLAFLLAALGTVTSLIKAASINYKEWKPIPDSKLMFSYFCGSGDFQRKLIYKSARKLVCDKTWPWISAAGLAYRLGNLSRSSRLLMFLLTFVYLPLAVVGIFEMFFRGIIGYVTYFLLNICVTILYLALRLINYILIPILRIIDNAMRIEQHCPHCYNTFKLPYFKCPHCDEVHQQLIPATSGLLFARCACGHFLPSSVISKRDRLSAVCPKCNSDLAAANAKQFSIQVIGGNSAGKTAFIAAFQHLYQANVGVSNCSVRVEPKDAFSDVEMMFANGCTEPSSPSEVIPYTFVHQTGNTSEQSLIFYDIPDEILLSEEYERNPLNFGYSDGIVVIIDPLSVPSVRNECEKINADAVCGAGGDSPDSIVIHFITKFSEISGRAARRMSKVPVAVLIAKSDITGIKNRVGMPKIKSIYKANPERYQNSLEVATDEVCRGYLADIGLGNILNNLDAVFSMVRCFPISSIGHTSKQGMSFEPYGVVEPIAWIGEKGRAGMAPQLKAVRECVSAEGFQEQMTAQNLVERYAKAEKLYRTGNLEAATKAFADLGGYKDAAERVEKIKEIRYKGAVKKQNDHDFDGAIRAFRGLGNYKDAAKRVISSQFAKVDFLVSEELYKQALDFLSTLPKSGVWSEKNNEVRYGYALYLIENQDYVAANTELMRLGGYRDSQARAASITVGRMRQAVKGGVNRKIKFGKHDWRVLLIENDMALLVTENAIKNIAYNDTLVDTYWSESKIRAYLNSDFLNEFTREELSLVQTSVIKTVANPDYNTPGGPDTEDKFFLLDIQEARRFFSSDSDRLPDTSVPGVATDWCWLRSSGGEKTYAAIIDKNGKISTGGSRVTNNGGGIRPAAFIKL